MSLSRRLGRLATTVALTAGFALGSVQGASVAPLSAPSATTAVSSGLTVGASSWVVDNLGRRANNPSKNLSELNKALDKLVNEYVKLKATELNKANRKVSKSTYERQIRNDFNRLMPLLGQLNPRLGRELALVDPTTAKLAAVSYTLVTDPYMLRVYSGDKRKLVPSEQNRIYLNRVEADSYLYRYGFTQLPEIISGRFTLYRSIRSSMSLGAAAAMPLAPYPAALVFPAIDSLTSTGI
jgi:hypothetical protein